MTNATFHAFKESGKWYTTDRGVLTKETFSVFSTQERRDEILKANDGCFPGMSGPGTGMIFVVIGDEGLDFGYPLLLKPV